MGEFKRFDTLWLLFLVSKLVNLVINNSILLDNIMYYINIRRNENDKIVDMCVQKPRKANIRYSTRMSKEKTFWKKCIYDLNKQEVTIIVNTDHRYGVFVQPYPYSSDRVPIHIIYNSFVYGILKKLVIFQWWPVVLTISLHDNRKRSSI